ncbi:MAG: hypothetical protein AAF467_16160 [Actinomycetota bacterium]
MGNGTAASDPPPVEGTALGELTPDAATEHSVVRRGSALNLAVVAVIAAGLVAGLGWLAFGAFVGGTDESASPEAATTDGSSSAASSADLAPAPFVDADGGPGALVDTEPLPDGDGLSLYVAFAQRVDGGPAIWHFDLGRGTWRDTSNRGTPLGATDDAVVIVRQLREQTYVAAIPVAEGNQRVLANAFQLVVDDRRDPAEAGSVWLLGPSEDERFAYRRVDLETGEVLDRVEAPLPEWDSVDAPSLIAASGEIFARTDGAYRAVAEGRVMAAGPDLVLVETCDAPDVCQLSWRAGPSLEPVDRPLPPGVVGTVWAMTDDGSVIVYSPDRSGIDLWVFDVETGVRRGPYAAALGAFPSASIVSPDQRFVAVPDGPILVIIDLTNGAEYELEIGARTIDGIAWAPHAEAIRAGDGAGG